MILTFFYKRNHTPITYTLCAIWGTHGDECKGYCLLGNDTTKSGRSLTTFGGHIASTFRVEENTLHTFNIPLKHQ